MSENIIVANAQTTTNAYNAIKCMQLLFKYVCFKLDSEYLQICRNVDLHGFTYFILNSMKILFEIN